jgi:hypothetical protein
MSGSRRGGEEYQPQIADLEHIAVAQRRGVDGFAVEIGAVQAPKVNDAECAVFIPELGMPAADRDVVEEDVAIRMTTGRRGGPVVHVKDA